MAKNYSRSYNQDSSSAMMIPIYNPQKQQKSSKCFVYCFTTFVLLFAILLVFSWVVILVKNPTLKIDSIAIKSLKYDNFPTLDLTAIMKISMKNRNFGHLDFDYKTNDIMSMIYGNDSVLGTSELMFRDRRVESRGTKEVQLEMTLSSMKSNFTGLRDDDVMKLNNDLSSGRLELVGYANFKGDVHLFKNKIIRSAIVRMNCTIGIDLIKQSVDRLIC
ncbi:late embryogenesis abundant protein At1g64065-like [Silene latifolia]|uniref:late embryogenesis abundant protein At1g64065-like n=1 Tax=Silene latifolia TaxID=37657 RepID=UPI003D778C30